MMPTDQHTKPRHTPGPWLRDGLLVYALHHNGDYVKGQPLLVNRFSARVEHYVSQGGSLTEAEANARLIAAAPDLLAALNLAVRVMEAFDVGVDQEMRAAIAKAEGE